MMSGYIWSTAPSP